MPRNRTLYVRVLPVWAVLVLLVSAHGYSQCIAASSISQWRCWEQTIVSGVDFYSSGTGNPYQDLTLRVTFTSGGTSFTQDAFWLGDTANPKNFKVRAALPPGTWSWQVAGCTGTTGGRDCSSGVTWTPSSGTITVNPDTTGPQLYARGFPKQNCSLDKVLPPNLVSCSPLAYGDGVTTFFWLGDTAWSAPAVEINAQLHGGTQYWSQYLASRTPDGTGPGNYHFTAILVAPADYYSISNDPDVFSSRPNCTVPTAQQGSYPNDCSIPKPAYWNAFDGIVSQATQQDLLLVIAGLMHPLDTHPYSKYPSLNNVKHFSRYVAARMAGFAVMFSPGFDMPVSGTAVDGSTFRQIMDGAGSSLQAASPRVIITNHLNGQATCTDYESFAGEKPYPLPWMTFYLFQSGHAANPNGVAGTNCPGYLSTETSVQAALRRAMQMPNHLATDVTSPNSVTLPSINGEGPYDDSANDNPPNYSQVNMRYRLRQAANVSSLSNAQGFSYGVPQLGVWSSPSSYWALPSVVDMQMLSDRFKAHPGMPTHSDDWIVNNPTSYDQRQALASDGSTTAIAYLPPTNPASPAQTSITLNTSGLPGLGCPGSGTWTFVWETPTTNATQSVLATSCSTPATGQIRIQSPHCTPQELASTECDWILLMTKTAGATVNTASASLPTPGKLDLWRDLSSGDGTSAILARPAGGAGDIIEVSPSGLALQDGARVASVPGGYFIVWHADVLDGSLIGVFGQRLAADGKLVGPMVRINSTTAYDQRDPAIAADPAGNTVVVWSSYGQDGDLGGIYGQLFDASGKLVGGEFRINGVTVGHQERPQVTYMPGGGFVVGWTTEAMGDDPGAVSLRLFDGTGSPRTDEIRIAGDAQFHPQLVDLEPDTNAGFSLRWLLRDKTRSTRASYVQPFTIQGSPSGGPVVVP